MGCFLSKNRPKKIRGGGAPPPPPPPPHPHPLPPEEEAVKEVVLSETSILRKPSLIDAAAAVWKNENPPGNHEFKVESVPVITAESIKPCGGEDFISQASEQSELCSYTESFSTTTTATANAPEKRDDGEEVTQRSPMKPGRRKRPNNGDLVVGARERNVRSPARRQAAAPSPEKRKPVQQVRGMTTGPRRNIGPRRHEGGEVSGRRRSRSPVTGGNVMVHKSTACGVKVTGGTAGRSPTRGVVNSHRTARAVEKSGGKSEVQSESDGVPAESSGGGKEEKQKDNEEERESLDNPLVSLECFIFL